MNLRTIYGEKVAKDLLKRPFHLGDDGNYHIRLVYKRKTWHCCVIGAANLVAARTYGHDLPDFAEQPSDWKANEDARAALDRVISFDEQAEIKDAMNEWDSNSNEIEDMIWLMEQWFGTEEAE